MSSPRGFEGVTIWPQVAALKLSKSTPINQSTNQSINHPAQLQPFRDTISYSMNSAEITDYSDRIAYQSINSGAQSISEELRFLQELNQSINQGSNYVSMLYTYRSISKAMPMVQADTPDSEKQEIHTATFVILRPEILKLKSFMQFAQSLIKLINQSIIFIQKQDNDRKVPSQELYIAICEALDLSIKFDALKDAKTSIVNDFSRYKRSFTPIKQSLTDSDSLSDEIHQLQLFLYSPQSPHNIMFFLLRQDLQKVIGYDRILIDLLMFCCEMIDKRVYITSEEFHRYNRLLTYLLYLIDTDPRDSSKINQLSVFKYTGKSKNYDLDRVKRLVRTMPIIPLFMDMRIDQMFVLKRIPHWEEDRMKNDWAFKSKDRKLSTRYSLTQQISIIRPQFLDYIANFNQQSNAIQIQADANQSINQSTLHSYIFLVLQGLRLLGEWQSIIASAAAYKYENPATINQSINQSTNQSNKPVCDPDANEYEKAVRYNYSGEELYALIDLLSMSKSLGGALLQRQRLIDCLIRRCIHDDIQIFLQFEVGESARKASKHKRNAAHSVMMAMRDWAGDFSNDTVRNGWKEKHPNFTDGTATSNPLTYYEKTQPGRDFTPRATNPSLSQIRGIRRLACTLFDDRSQGMQGSFFGGDRTLTKDQTTVWNDFYEVSFYWPYLLNCRQTIIQSTDFSFLWFREFYLELTKSIQFPISQSLPWILIEFLIKKDQMSGNSNGLFFALDLYNDAANTALYVLRCQFLYDEIECECNLSYEQMVYELARDAFKYYKSLACELLVNKSVLDKHTLSMQQKRKTTKPSINQNRYLFLFQQQNVLLLGRHINLNLALTSPINTLLREYLEGIMKRFESNDLTEIVEFDWLIEVWRTIHHELSVSLPGLDSAEDQFNEVNENTVIGQHRTRILVHVLSELISDLIPNYVWNDSTERFHASPQSFVDRPERSRQPSQPASFYFSQRHATMLSEYFAMYRTCFSSSHFRSLANVLSSTELSSLYTELATEIQDKIDLSLSPYFQVLLQGLPSIPQPDIAKYQMVGVYGLIDIKLRNSLGQYVPLRGAVFHFLREIGNTFAFISQLERESKLQHHTSFMFTAHFHSLKGQLTAMRSTDSPFLIRSEHQREASYAAALKDSSPFFSQLVDGQRAHSHLTDLAQNAVSMYTYDEKQHSTSVLAGVFNKIIQSIQSKHYDLWKSQGQSEHSNDLPRLLSCLLFIFCQAHDINTSSKDQNPATIYLGKDSALFGDGFLIALMMMLHALGDQHKFDVIDYCHFIVNSEAMHPIDRNKFMADKKSKTMHAPSTNGLEKDEWMILEFVHNYRDVKQKLTTYEAMFKRMDTQKVNV